MKTLRDQPLITYEVGSTGRQHVMEAFQRYGVLPRIEMEATTTDLIVRMVAAGLGVAIVPLLSSGVVTRGQRVECLPLGNLVRPILSGLLLRTNEPLNDPATAFLEFVRSLAKDL